MTTAILGAEAGAEIGALGGPIGMAVGAVIGLVIGGALGYLGMKAISAHMSNANEKADEKLKDASASDVCSDCQPPDDKKDTKPKSLDEIEKDLENKDFDEAEEYLDKELRDKQGFEKKPLKKGDGFRYIDGKGRSVSINKGYPEGLAEGGGDSVHNNPYVKIQPAGRRFPLRGE